ncbi:Alpha/beta hydrolase fold-1 [Annulohypoxylon nitens]|nr:Alpha/beta hydrolase fold-1 [Annulohypoxylon nitens]
MPELSLVIVPAASALPLFYDTVVDGVSQHGYDIKALHIPSVGLVTGARPGEPPNMYDDAAFISAHVTGLADAGHDVLLITHSYGGTAATQSVQGLSKNERLKQGKSGGIVGLAYMTSLVPEVGYPATSSASAAKTTDGQEPLMVVGDDGWFYYPNLTLTAEIVFSDLPLEEGKYWGKKLVKQSAASFSTILTYAGYKDVPVSYLVAEGDKSILPATQRSQIAMIERVTGNKVDVSTVDSGHVATISHPQNVIDYILKVAQKFT